MLILLLVLSSNAQTKTASDELRQCTEMLTMCVQLGEQALKEADDVIASQNKALELNKQIIADQKKQLDGYNQWYRRPETLLLTGVLLGIILFK